MSKYRPRLTGRGLLSVLNHLLRENKVKITEQQLMHVAVGLAQLHGSQVIPTADSLEHIMRDERIFAEFDRGMSAYYIAKKLELSPSNVRRILGDERLRMRRAEREGKQLEKVKARWL